MNPTRHISNLFSSALTGILLLLGVFGSTSLNAQGWEKYIGGNQLDEIFSVSQTADQGFIATGYIDETKTAVFRLDPEGQIMWSRDNLDANSGGQGHGIIETTAGDIVLVGSCNSCGSGSTDINVIKLDAFGKTIWSRGYGGAENDNGWDIIEASDGSILVTGSFDNGANDNVYFLKLDPNNGDILLERTYNGSNNGDDQGLAIIESSIDQNYIIAGSTNFGTNNPHTYLLKIDATTGDTIWTREWDNGGVKSIAYDIIESINSFNGLVEGYAITGSFNNNDILFLKTDLNGDEVASATYGDQGVDQGSAILQTEDGGYLIAGLDELKDTLALPTLIKTDASGFRIWSKTYGTDVGATFITAIARSMAPVKEGGYIIAGARSEVNSLPFDFDAMFFKVDLDGEYFTNNIQGRIFFDFDDDCEMDMNEFGFENWSIEAKGNRTFYQTSDADGFFNIPVAAGNYTVTLVPPSGYWSSCNNSINIGLNNPYDSTTLNFPVQIEELCAYLEVDASTPYLTPCASSDYFISYCNKGTTSAKDAYIIADLDPSLILTGSTQDFTFLGGNTYRFDLDNIAITDCDSFKITVFVDCNVVEGQTHCLEAHIYPDTLCVPVNPVWDGSSLSLEATCNGGQVDLRISNTGNGDMAEAQGFVIIEDDLMLRPSGPIQLGKGQDSLLIRPANGTTYRIVMEQPEGHPGKGMPTVAIEGCVDGGGPFSTGYFTTFAEDDADNFLVKDCQENIPSTDIPSHAKRGYPKGYGDDRLITPETELKYVLNFENNGILDTAIRMVIRDTLSPFLDPTTVRPGASSHDYTFEVTGEGILKFTFEDINLLPGGSAQSRGFVKYTVSQKPNNPSGALIKNGAAIFYNYGHPNYTENTCHKIEDFVRVSTQEIFNPQVQEVKVFPNPFVDQATVEIVGSEDFRAIRFLVFDTSGKLVYQQQADGPVFTISRNNLPAGFYFYQLEANAQLISTGKMIMQ